MITKYGLKWIEGDRGDDYILRENNYRVLFITKSSLCPGDTWLDIGAHFGSFALRAAQRVSGVVAVEPDPGNFAQLRENMLINEIENVEIVKAAVIGRPDQPVPLGIGRTFDYTTRVGNIRGRRTIMVDGVNVNKLIREYGINKIKMDCEGSEEEIVRDLDFEPIEELIMEWHFTLIPDPDWTKLAWAITRLKEEGFTILRSPLGEPTKRWTAIIWARKE